MIKKKEGAIKKNLKKFWEFLHEDSWQSLAVSLVIAFILIKFILFPFLTFVTGSALPLVIVESCSMHHDEKGFEEIIKKEVYGDYGLDLEDSESWFFQNGFNKGDIMFVLGPENLKVGDVLIFNGGETHPVIHRIVSIRNTKDGTIYATMGDNNPGQIEPSPRSSTDETKIHEDQLIGKAVFRVPVLGWVKLIFFDWGSDNPGLC